MSYSNNPHVPRASVTRVLPPLLLAALLSGCVLGPNFHAPAAPVATQYTSAPAADATLSAVKTDSTLTAPDQWWSLLNSPSLDDSIRQALQANHGLDAARSTLLQAQEVAAASQGGLWPTVALGASTGRVKYGAAFLGPEKFPSFTYYSIGPSVSYAFDYDGGVRRSIEQQQALALYQQHELDAAALTVSGNVALQALAAAAARAQLLTLQELLQEDAQNLKLVQDAFDAGGGTRVDILNARSQLANDQTLLPPLRSALANAEHALAVLLGQSPGSFQAPQFTLQDFSLPSAVPLTLPSELVHRRPDILAAEAQLHAATAAVGVASANLYPQISLAASATMQSLTLRGLFDASANAWGLSGSLTEPLFDHGTLRAKQRAAVDAMQASLANYEQVVLNSFGQVADALEDLNHDQELLDSERSALSVSAENLALTRESFSAGNTGVLQVLEAQRQDQQARLGLVRAQVQQLRDTIQLLLALGGRAPSA